MSCISFLFIFYFYIWYAAARAWPHVFLQGAICCSVKQSCSASNSKPRRRDRPNVFSLCCPVNDKSCLETVQSGRWLRTAFIFIANLSLPFPLHAVRHHIQVKAVHKPRNTTSLYAQTRLPNNQNRWT